MMRSPPRSMNPAIRNRCFNLKPLPSEGPVGEEWFLPAFDLAKANAFGENERNRYPRSIERPAEKEKPSSSATNATADQSCGLSSAECRSHGTARALPPLALPSKINYFISIELKANLKPRQPCPALPHSETVCLQAYP
jgi:hypothetical protein